MIRVLFPDPAEEITETECKERIHTKYGYRGFDVYKSNTSSQIVEFFPRCITVKQEIVDPDWKMDIHEKISIDWSKLLEIIQEDDTVIEYLDSQNKPTSEEILSAWCYFKNKCEGMTANDAAAYFRKNNHYQHYWGGDIRFECSPRGITINQKEEITWFSFCLQAMDIEEDHAKVTKGTAAGDFNRTSEPSDEEPDNNENAVFDFTNELMNNISKRDWETALSNLAILEEMLRSMLENNQ